MRAERSVPTADDRPPRIDAVVNSQVILARCETSPVRPSPQSHWGTVRAAFGLR